MAAWLSYSLARRATMSLSWGTGSCWSSPLVWAAAASEVLALATHRRPAVSAAEARAR